MYTLECMLKHKDRIDQIIKLSLLDSNTALQLVTFMDTIILDMLKFTLNLMNLRWFIIIISC